MEDSTTQVNEEHHEGNDETKEEVQLGGSSDDAAMKEEADSKKATWRHEGSTDDRSLNDEVKNKSSNDDTFDEGHKMHEQRGMPPAAVVRLLEYSQPLLVEYCGCSEAPNGVYQQAFPSRYNVDSIDDCFVDTFVLRMEALKRAPLDSMIHCHGFSPRRQNSIVTRELDVNFTPVAQQSLEMIVTTAVNSGAIIPLWLFDLVASFVLRVRSALSERSGLANHGYVAPWTVRLVDFRLMLCSPIERDYCHRRFADDEKVERDDIQALVALLRWLQAARDEVVQLFAAADPDNSCLLGERPVASVLNTRWSELLAQDKILEADLQGMILDFDEARGLALLKSWFETISSTVTALKDIKFSDFPRVMLQATEVTQSSRPVFSSKSVATLRQFVEESSGRISALPLFWTIPIHDDECVEFCKVIVLVGTAHVSKQSVEEVRSVVTKLKPDSVLVELCWNRVGMVQHVLFNEQQRQRLSARQASTPQGQENQPKIASAQSHAETPSSVAPPAVKVSASSESANSDAVASAATQQSTANAIAGAMSWWYERVASTMDVEPGQEFVEAIQSARHNMKSRSRVHRPTSVILGDRPATLLRCWTALTFTDKLKLLLDLVSDINMDLDDVERLKNADIMDSLLTELRETLPQLEQPLLIERDDYMATSALLCPRFVVCIIGLGHKASIVKKLRAIAPMGTVESPHQLSPVVLTSRLAELRVVPEHSMTIRRFAVIVGLGVVVASVLMGLLIFRVLPGFGVHPAFTMLFILVLLFIRTHLFSFSVSETLRKMEEKHHGHAD